MNHASFVPETSLFAKLLAEENLNVRIDRSLSTAAFDTEQRTLFLPSLANFDEDAWLLFIAHEVGHAKFTPTDWRTRPDVQALIHTYGIDRVHRVLNILEDIRIERAIRARYRGLSGTFARGYRSLLSREFFGFALNAMPAWDSYSPLDRLNLYAKVGGLLHLSLLDAQERAWYTRVCDASSFTEVVAVATDVLHALTTQQQSQQKQQQPSQDQQQPSQDQQQDDQQDQQPSSSQSPSQDDQPLSQDESQKTSQDAQDDTNESQDNAEGQSASPSPTAQETETPASSESSESSESSAPSAQGAGEQTTAPTADPFSTTTQDAAAAFVKRAAREGYNDAVVVVPRDVSHLHLNDWALPDVLAQWEATPAERAALWSLLVRERKNAHAVLASMVNTFRQYQSAWQLRREEVARTGALDMSKLSQYKLAEDIFLRRTEVPNAQNHGLVLTIDWSGSMDGSIATVLWQTLHLIWFAEQLRIPVTVFAFGDQFPVTKAWTEKVEAAASGSREWAYYRYTSATTGLVTLYTSAAPQAQRQDAQSHLLCMALGFARVHHNAGHNLPYFSETLPKAMHGIATEVVRTLMTDLGVAHRVLPSKFMHLGGTPLLHAVVSVTDYVATFREQHRLEQCVSVFLTDGDDGHGLRLSGPAGMRQSQHSTYWEREDTHYGPDVTLVDPVSGRVFAPVVGAQSALPQTLAYHRARTNATVVVVDMTSSPLTTYRRFLSSSDVAPYYESWTDAYGRLAGTRRQVRTKTVKQTRRNVVIRRAQKNFADAGLFTIDPSMASALTVDAVLVSHPAWWLGDAFAKRAASKIADTMTGVFSQRDEEDDEFEAAPTVKLSAALTETSGTVAMRKFADMLVPYLATGRVDVR